MVINYLIHLLSTVSVKSRKG